MSFKKKIFVYIFGTHSIRRTYNACNIYKMLFLKNILKIKYCFISQYAYGNIYGKFKAIKVLKFLLIFNTHESFMYAYLN